MQNLLAAADVSLADESCVCLNNGTEYKEGYHYSQFIDTYLHGTSVVNL